MKIHLTRQWTQEEWARWLDDEVRIITSMQIVALVSASGAIGFVQRASETGFWRAGAALVLCGIATLVGTAAIILGMDCQTGIPQFPFKTLRLRRTAGWAATLAGISLGTWGVDELPPLIAAGLVIVLHFALPRPWRRGVDRTPSSVPYTDDPARIEVERDRH